MSKRLTCVAVGRPEGWEAICLEFDLAVTGRSFEECYTTMRHAISTYIEDARKQKPEQRDRLLNRSAPLRVKLAYVFGYCWSWLRGKTSDDGEAASFTVNCHA